MTWVTQSFLQEQRGYTPGQCKARRQRGRWQPGEHYALVDGVYMYNIEKIDARVAEAAKVGRESGKVVQLK